MLNISQTTVAAFVALALQMSTSGAALAAAGDGHVSPAKMEAIAGSKVKRVTLTQKAAQRIDIQTDKIQQDAAGKTIAPFGAVVYDLAGEAWVYTNPEPLTFIRQKIVVEVVKGDKVYLKEGPAQGSSVVIVGVAELYGAERGIGH